jgi:hypothetical protein
MKRLLSILAVLALALLAACDQSGLEHTFTNPSPDGETFANRIAVDGDRVVIRGSRSDGSYVYLFDAVSGGLSRTFSDPNSNGNFSDVAVSGHRILIGDASDDTHGINAGQAYLFDATNGALLGTFDDPTVNVSEGGRFGSRVALEGERVLIGEPNDDTYGAEVGQAHLFDAATGALLWTFNDPTPDSGTTLRGSFGSAVALDGDLVLIGEPDDNSTAYGGQAHLFDATTGAWLWTFGGLGGRFGERVVLDGDLVLIASGDPSQVHLFDATTGSWLRTFEDPTGDWHDFGASIALDGNRVLVGAPWHTSLNFPDILYSGRAYLFDATTGALLRTFDIPVAAHGLDKFGEVVALDGNRVLIGAPDHVTLTGKQGQAYLFYLFRAQ